MEDIIPRHGVLTQLLSDREIIFLSKLMIEAKVVGTKEGQYYRLPLELYNTQNLKAARYFIKHHGIMVFS